MQYCFSVYIFWIKIKIDFKLNIFPSIFSKDFAFVILTLILIHNVYYIFKHVHGVYKIDEWVKVG